MLLRTGERVSGLFNFEGTREGNLHIGSYSHGGIAQMGEHLLCKQGVKGSNPFISTTWADSSAG